MKSISIVGIDLAKEVFHLHGANEHGKCIFSKSVRRNKLRGVVINLPPCCIAMEACSSSHYWGREFKKMGHEVVIIPPRYVKPYVKTNKNDRADAEGICEAASRENMRFAHLKSESEQEISDIHSSRESLVKTRTAIVCGLKARLREWGIILNEGAETLNGAITSLLSSEEGNSIAPITQVAIRSTLHVLKELNEQIAVHDKQIKELCKDNETCKRLMEIPGVGNLTASMASCLIGNGSRFKNGRHLSAYLGLTPKQFSTGGRTILGGISKNGNRYMRKLLIQGAMSAIRCAKMQIGSKRCEWLRSLLARRSTCQVAVALANKHARILWRLLAKNESYNEALAWK